LILSRPWNSRELFNFRHAQLWNIIEQIFGVMKKRFWVLLLPQEYPIEMQVCLVPTLTVLHNIIWVYDPNDKVIDEDFIPDTCNDSQTYSEGIEHSLSAEERGRAAKCRDDIAQVMWRDYMVQSCCR